MQPLKIGSCDGKRLFVACSLWRRRKSRPPRRPRPPLRPYLPLQSRPIQRTSLSAQPSNSPRLSTGTGTISQDVTWAVFAPSNSTLSPGTLTSSGLYTTPYPAPATVTIVATSTQDKTINQSVTVTLSPPATTAGPALAVDVSNQTHPISPYIYGMNAYLLDSNTVKTANLSIDRWGGDSTSRYNYLLDVTSDAADWYFENAPGTSGDGGTAVTGLSAFDALVTSNNYPRRKDTGHGPCPGLGREGFDLLQLSCRDVSAAVRLSARQLGLRGWRNARPVKHHRQRPHGYKHRGRSVVGR